MLDQSMALIGLVTGPIGAITGTLALLISWRSYRLARRTKRTERMLELKRVQADIEVSLDEVRPLISDYIKSRERLLAASGQFKSGAMKKFNNRVCEAKKHMENIVHEYDAQRSAVNENREESLERALSEGYRIQRRLKALHEEFGGYLQEDNQARARHSNARR